MALLAARPNPFRGEADLGFVLDASSEVTLVVYDALGREVRTLARGPFASGEHHVSFVASGLASGVYLVRLSAGEAVRTQQVVVAR